MPVINQNVCVVWNGNNKKFYTELGFTFTFTGDSFECNVDLISDNANIEVKIKCDYCGKEDSKPIRRIRNRSICFCSKECADRYRVGKTNKKTVIRKCDECNIEKEYDEAYSNRRKEKIFCCKKCADTYRRGKENTALKKRLKVNCYTCHSEFELPPHRMIDSKRHFCSRKCQSSWQSSTEYSTIHTSPDKSVEIKCDCCNKMYTTLKVVADKNNKNFCSMECKNSSSSLWLKNPNPTKDKIAVICDHCGQEKYIHESIFKKNKNHFCSRNCYWEWRKYSLSGEDSPNYNRIDSNCKFCEKSIKIIPYEANSERNNFCSQECYWNFRKIYYIKDKHPLFGKTISAEQVEKMRIGLVKRYENGDLVRNTSIQLKVNKILEELDVSYKNEYNCKYYSIDNFLIDHNLMIEVMGDYWHSNPQKYKKMSELNDVQFKGIKRDKAKRTYVKLYKNINILYLWEGDIHNNIELCKKLIILYVENRGLLDNYNSFNYSLINENICINNSFVLPFFERNETKLYTGLK